MRGRLVSTIVVTKDVILPNGDRIIQFNESGSYATPAIPNGLIANRNELIRILHKQKMDRLKALADEYGDEYEIICDDSLTITPVKKPQSLRTT